MATLVGSEESLPDLGISDAAEFNTFAGDNHSIRIVDNHSSLPATATEPATGTTPDQAEPMPSSTTPEADSVLSGTTTDPAGQDQDATKLPTPRADVLVMIPFLPLLGITDEPAELDGYGPIPASMARELLAGGAESFRRVLVDPRDGTPLEIGRTSYRLTKAMKKALQLRDGKCVFPGCNNNALDNDTDHLKAWQYGGTTGISNLAQLCPKHHRLKHNSRWEPTAATKNEQPGWTSPTGRHYIAEQPDRHPPQWPPGIRAALLPPGVVFQPVDPLEDLTGLPWWEDIENKIADADIPDFEIPGFSIPDDPSDLEDDQPPPHYPEWALILERENSQTTAPHPSG